MIVAPPFSMSRLWHHVSIHADVDGFVIPSPPGSHVLSTSFSLSSFYLSSSHAVLLPLSSFSLSLSRSLSREERCLSQATHPHEGDDGAPARVSLSLSRRKFPSRGGCLSQATHPHEGDDGAPARLSLSPLSRDINFRREEDVFPRPPIPTRETTECPRISLSLSLSLATEISVARRDVFPRPPIPTRETTERPRCLVRGREIHSFLIASGLLLRHSGGVFLHNAVMDMYAKCGSMDEAVAVFEGILAQDVAS